MWEIKKMVCSRVFGRLVSHGSLYVELLSVRGLTPAAAPFPPHPFSPPGRGRRDHGLGGPAAAVAAGGRRRGGNAGRGAGRGRRAHARGGDEDPGLAAQVNAGRLQLGACPGCTCIYARTARGCAAVKLCARPRRRGGSERRALRSEQRVCGGDAARLRRWPLGPQCRLRSAGPVQMVLVALLAQK